MEYYSQFGQDKFLYENFFLNKTDGFFVDIGAHDGITASNTYFFEKLGWSGVCFEPIPSVFEKLQNNRKCITKNLALSNKSGVEQFFVLKGYSEMLSGLVNSYEENHIVRINREVEEHPNEYNYIDVNCSTFNEEIIQTHIDILSIDTEGSEYNIMKSIDFNKYKIDFITFEMNYYDKRLLDLVESKNFTFVENLGVDFIFKNNLI
jgi:FkbM family methyltransferase